MNQNSQHQGWSKILLSAVCQVSEHSLCLLIRWYILGKEATGKKGELGIMEHLAVRDVVQPIRECIWTREENSKQKKKRKQTNKTNNIKTINLQAAWYSLCFTITLMFS